MLEPYFVTFAGHRNIDRYSEVEEKLYQIIVELLRTKDYVGFYVGNDGDFDRMAASCVRRAKKNVRDDNCSLNLVLPYPKANMEFMEKSFDSIIIPPELYSVHPKKAITMRNRWMVAHCDVLIAYVLRDKGGAATMLKYAIKKNIVCFKLKNATDIARLHRP